MKSACGEFFGLFVLLFIIATMHPTPLAAALILVALIILGAKKYATKH